MIIAVSEFTKNEIIRLLEVDAAKIRVTHEAADERFRVLNDAEKGAFLRASHCRAPYILFVSTVEPRKNLPTLIEAFAEFRRTDVGHNYSLLIAGGAGWGTDEARSAVERANATRAVQFLGYVTEADLVGYYNCARMFVFPSHYEGFGIPPLEAMACGCPVICSNAASLPEVVGDAALTFGPKDQGRLVELMTDLAQNEDLGEELSRKGSEQAKKFSWRRCAEETAAVYREVLES